MTKYKERPMVLFLFGIFILWGFGYETVWRAFQTDVSGVVISSRNAHHWYEHGYSTRYLIRGADGRDRPYLAGGTEASLPRDMPVGTTITKQRWHLNYQENGHPVRFPIAFYIAMLTLAVLAIGRSFSLWCSIHPFK